MAKGSKQIEAEHKQRMAERRKYLQENPEVYQRDFDEAFKKYLAREFSELDPQDCDNRFDPHLRKGFIENWPQEAQWLSLKYHLGSVWDPDGDEEPFPVADQAARAIRGQNKKIYLNQIQKHSIINLPPHKVFGRFLIAEIDLSKPRAQIKADIMAIVDLHRKKVKISGSYHELVSPPEPRDKELSYTYKPMEVWKMVEEERHDDEKVSKVMWRIAKVKTSQTTNSNDEEKWRREERRNYEALCNSYARDKRIYYGN